MLPNEDFIAHLEEMYSNWDDDSDMVLQLVRTYLAKPGSINFNTIISLDKAQFARELLKAVLEKKNTWKLLFFRA